MYKDGARPLSAYDLGVQALGPLPRAVFLLHRLDDLPYGQIAARLSIEVPVVEACIASALVTIAQVLAGEQPSGPQPPVIAGAEAILFREYTACRARRAICATLHVVQSGAPQTPPNTVKRWPGLAGRWLRLTAPPFQYRRNVSHHETFDEWLRHRGDHHHDCG